MQAQRDIDNARSFAKVQIYTSLCGKFDAQVIPAQPILYIYTIFTHNALSIKSPRGSGGSMRIPLEDLARLRAGIPHFFALLARARSSLSRCFAVLAEQLPVAPRGDLI